MRNRPWTPALLTLLLAVLAGGLAACDDARASPGDPAVSFLAQEADSISYRATWPAGRNADGTMAPSHDWSADADDGSWGVGGTVPAADSASDGSLSTVFTVPMDSTSTPATFCVAARNANGTSPEACVGFTVPALALPPSAPGDPSVDTTSSTTAVRLDSLRIWPDSSTVASADTAYLHAFLYTDDVVDGASVSISCVELTDGRRGWHYAERGSAPPAVDFPSGVYFEEDADCGPTWEVAYDSIVGGTPNVEGLFVANPDSASDGVRSVQYGVYWTAEDVAMAQLASTILDDLERVRRSEQRARLRGIALALSRPEVARYGVPARRTAGPPSVAMSVYGKRGPVPGG